MIETRYIQTDTELYQAAELASAAFGSRNPDVESLKAHPLYRPEVMRVRVMDGRVVAHLRIVDRTLRVGLAEWRMGGISAVCTSPEFRKQGHASALLEDAIQWMTSQGFDMTLLTGIPDFYDRFGYAVCWPTSFMSIPIERAAALDQLVAVAPAGPDDIPDLSSLYEQSWGKRTVSLTRDEPYWRWLCERGGGVWIARNARGTACGYIGGLNDREASVAELVADHPDAARSLLAFSAHRLQSAGRERMRVLIARGDPVVGWLRRVVPVQLIEETLPAGGWMARFISLESAMQKMQEEFSVRLLRSTLRDWRGRINFETDLGTVALSWRYGHVTVSSAMPRGGFTCRLPQDRLMQLVLGFRTPSDVAMDVDVQIPEEAIPLLDVLFPPDVGAIAGLDWF
ncbi:MAG: hypothetical protein Kow0047_00080 [Anaerolineae bacterium]